jgi:hypothetical protein
MAQSLGDLKDRPLAYKLPVQGSQNSNAQLLLTKPVQPWTKEVIS